MKNGNKVRQHFLRLTQARIACWNRFTRSRTAVECVYTATLNWEQSGEQRHLAKQSSLRRDTGNAIVRDPDWRAFGPVNCLLKRHAEIGCRVRIVSQKVFA